MADIFISYANEDEKRVRPLADALKAEGWSVFWDRTIPPGESWVSYIGEALDEARCVIVVWSKDSIKSGWVYDEAQRARNRGVLVPTSLDDVEPPLGFGTVQAAKLIGWEGATSLPAFSEFLGALERRLGPSPAEKRRKVEAEEERRRQEKQEAKPKAEEKKARRAEQQTRKKAEVTTKPKTEVQSRRRKVTGLWMGAAVALLLVAVLVTWQVQRETALERQRVEDQRQVLNETTLAVNEALSAVNEAVASAHRMTTNLTRIQTLIEQGNASQTDFDAAREVLETAKAKVIVARRRLDRARENAQALQNVETVGDEESKSFLESVDQQVSHLEEIIKQLDSEDKRLADLQIRTEEERQRQAKIADLLAMAEKAIGELRLTSPSGRNALEYYKSVLALDPSSQEAKHGLGRIVDRYVELADAAIEEDAFDEANGFLDLADKVQPGAEVVQLARERLVSAKQVVEEEKRRQEEAKLQAERTRPGRSFRDMLEDGSKGPEMVVVPAGKFTMGSATGESEEEPPHSVVIGRPFAIGRYEVTFEDYDKCVAAGECREAKDEGWKNARRPVINVSGDDAVTYAKWLSEVTGKRYRLPSEAEWEYAARAESKTDYWWGNEVGQNRANCRSCGSQWDYKQTAPVGSFAANAFGVHDTAGNVWEWVQDCWHDSYTGAPSDGSAWEEADGGNCSRRVFRGGSWFNKSHKLRSAYRDWNDADDRHDNLGFRLAQDL